MLNRKQGKILKILSERGSVQEALVEIDGAEYSAVNYLDLTGSVSSRDSVLVNTTAVNLNLGTGGVHFVVCNLSNPAQGEQPALGHIMKLRYTPLQTAVLSVEEDDSPHQHEIRDFQGLDGMPVVCCELHSQIAPAAAAVKAFSGHHLCVAYVMTDGAALPIAFSRLVLELKEKGLLDTTITCGQAFGGDIEAINVYTGLVAAKQVVRADVAIVCQGPGNAGACSKYGFSGIQQGEALNAVSILGGKPIAVPRISFADPRERHRGISHHSKTVLSEIAMSPVSVVLPELTVERLGMLQDELAPCLSRAGHLVFVRDGEPGLRELENKLIHVTTMGRSVEEDREFFLAAAAAGVLSAESLLSV